MILVDSSCWIEFLRPGGDQGVRAAVAAALESGDAAVCDVTRVEILGNIARQPEYATTTAVLAAAEAVRVEAPDYERAIDVGRALRKSGYSAPAVDLILAGAAIHRGAMVLHADRHFETMGAVAGLRQRFVDRNKA